ncbi:hypothetical protein ACFWVT_05615 [Streptomyces cyaneofuscatus]|uniref:hypothetical protein n=1 Tax=Streptomyces cyaneofuscatus TaxID=66883 RepID=UPI00365F5121
MNVQDSAFDTTTGHYDQCPQHTDPTDPRCHYEGIIAAHEAYYEEPPNREH